MEHQAITTFAPNVAKIFLKKKRPRMYLTRNLLLLFMMILKVQLRTLIR
ncbi:hypothetical protein RDI58_018640 [Solanum bulbocastanum]|uniref:Uncharacterized protein n=1 Tax=Solanum bulbocastanum TaxID=147425 RepID=A0AAN8Y9X6_SOLBU